MSLKYGEISFEETFNSYDCPGIQILKYGK